MSLLENIREAFRSIQSNLLRTILTALIVSIGIFALVGILTAIDALKASLNSTFASLGANSFDIAAKGYTNKFRRGGVKGHIYPAISYLQATQYKQQLGDEGRVGISAFISGATKVKAGSEETNPNTQVMAGDENYLLNQSYNLSAGRAFSQLELDNGSSVAIIGTEIREKLFGNTGDAVALGKYVYLLGRRFQVVGVLERSGSGMGGGGGADRLVLLPLSTGNQMPRKQALTYDIKTAVARPENLAFAMDQARGLMRAVRHDPLGQEDSFEMESSDSLSGKLDAISGQVKGVGGAVAALALLGASIALLNIMLVSVTERTREIGIRKALGATSRQIRLQFLIEAIVICLLGGALGILLGVLGGNLVTLFVGEGTFLVPWLWMTLGLALCIGVGTAAGYYPASRAAQLDPIESLRYE